MPLEDNVTVQMQVTGAMSMSACVLLFVSCYLFSELRSKGYIKLLLNVCIASFFFSTAVVIGSKEHGGSVGCWYQGLTANYWGVSQVLWILVISYELYSVVLQSRVLRTDTTRYHYFCWLFPLVTTFAPLTTNTYGRVAGQVHLCGIDSLPNSPNWGTFFWTIASFYFWIWLTIGFITFGFLRILSVFRSKAKSGVPVPPSIRGSVIMLGVYPLILVLCWIVPTFSRIWFFFPHNGPKYPGYYTVTIMCNILPNLMGFLIVLALFVTSEEIRRCWYDMLFISAQDRDSFSGSRSNKISSSRSSSLRSDDPLMLAAKSGGPNNRSDNHVNVSITNPMSAMAETGGEYRETIDGDDEERYSRFSQLGRFLAPTFGFGGGMRNTTSSRASTTSSRASSAGGMTATIGMTSLHSTDSGNSSSSGGDGAPPSFAGTPAGATLVPTRDNPVPVIDGPGNV